MLSTYWQRRLPHWVPENSAIFVTWRLAGSKPPFAPGAGPQWLGLRRVADICAQALTHSEAARRFYDLLAWVVMPNHVHVVMTPITPLPRSEEQLASAIAYVEDNPVRGGVAACAEEWPWSSAYTTQGTGGKTAGATGIVD